jgi:hypothetical protein
MKYLILSMKHTPSDGTAQWENSGRWGYTTDVNRAGRFDKVEAQEIVAGSRGGSIAVPEDAIQRFVTRTTIELTDGDNETVIECIKEGQS